MSGVTPPTRTFRYIRDMHDYNDLIAPAIGQAIVWDGTKYGPTTIPAPDFTPYARLDGAAFTGNVSVPSLTLNGVNRTTWPATTPGGSDTQVQFNDGSTFGGDSGLVFNKTTNVLTSTGASLGLGGVSLTAPATGGEIVVTAGAQTIAGAKTFTGEIKATVSGEDLLTVDNTSDGRLRIDATGAHAQYLEFTPRGSTGYAAGNAKIRSSATMHLISESNYFVFSGDAGATAAVSVTGGFYSGNGSAAAPSFTFNNSGTTGFYRAAADTIGISIAGVARGQWDSTGLYLLGAGFSGGLKYTDGGILYVGTTTAAPMDLMYGGTTVGRINASGLDIGPNALLMGSAVGTTDLRRRRTAAATETLDDGAGGAANQIINGKLGIGTAGTPAVPLEVIGGFYQRQTDGGDRVGHGLVGSNWRFSSHAAELFWVSVTGGVDFGPNALKFGSDIGTTTVALQYSSSGVAEITTGTAGVWRDLKLRNLEATTAITAASVTTTGAVTSTLNGGAGIQIAVGGQPAVGMRRNDSIGGLDLYANDTTDLSVNLSSLALILKSSVVFGWSGTAVTQPMDLGLSRIAGPLLEVNNGTPGTLRGLVAASLNLGGPSVMKPLTSAPTLANGEHSVWFNEAADSIVLEWRESDGVLRRKTLASDI